MVARLEVAAADDPGAAIDGIPTSAWQDVLATKTSLEDKSQHRQRQNDDVSVAARHQRWTRIAAVLLTAVRSRAPGLLFHARFDAVPYRRTLADIFDTPFRRGWTILQIHLSRIIDARRDASNSLRVLSTFVTPDALCHADAEDKRRDENRREGPRRRRHRCSRDYVRELRKSMKRKKRKKRVVDVTTLSFFTDFLDRDLSSSFLLLFFFFFF